MSHKKQPRIDPLEMRLPRGGADSHAHLDGGSFDMDREDALARARECGLSHICNVFLGVDDYRQKKNFFRDHPEVFFILGIHPSDGEKCREDAIEAMRESMASDSRIRAVGEIGLDFHWDDCPREIQMQAFAMQLDLARACGLPVVIHCREAEAECLAMLEARGFSGYPLLWHCFGGGPDLARHILANGWHISIPGTVTYPSNRALAEACAVIPADRLLLETDAPYLPPVPWRGTRNEPAYAVFTAREVARARNEDPARLWLGCGANTRRFFGLGR